MDVVLIQKVASAVHDMASKSFAKCRYCRRAGLAGWAGRGPRPTSGTRRRGPQTRIADEDRRALPIQCVDAWTYNMRHKIHGAMSSNGSIAPCRQGWLRPLPSTPSFLRLLPSVRRPSCSIAKQTFLPKLARIYRNEFYQCANLLDKDSRLQVIQNFKHARLQDPRYPPGYIRSRYLHADS